jgi:3-oxoacyl-[acyl-carrier protein] reductase
MDLGIAGKSALVCAASKGLGRACAVALAREGAHVTIVARHDDALQATAGYIRGLGTVEVTPVRADITTVEGRGLALDACPQPDILVNNAGGPPPGDFRDWTRDDWLRALDANMLTPIELIKATLDGMIQREFGRVVNITSGAVKAPIALLGLSNGARAGLTGFVAGLARQVAGQGVTINNLLPGAFETDRLGATLEAAARRQGCEIGTVRKAREQTIPAGRFGDPAEFGDACAYLCSVQAAYITGQNILIDGGAFPGTL